MKLLASRSSNLWLVALAGALLAHGSAAVAATLYSSGTKTWNTSTANWGAVSGGPYDTAIWSNVTPDSAVFQGTAGTVTLATDISIDSMTISLPTAGVTGYFIGDAAEDNTLNFSGTATVTLTATGNATNQDATIRAGITGTPTMNITGRNDNSANTFTLAPEGSVTQTIGTLNMLNTLSSNKRLILGGTSAGNVADTVTWAVTSSQLRLIKAGNGSWTINNNLSLDDGRLFLENGTLTVGGLDNFVSHSVRVNTLRDTTTNSGGLAKLVARGDWTLNDTREDFLVQGNGTISPGTGIETLSVDWGTLGGSTGEFIMQDGSFYEWEVGASNLTDIIDIKEFVGTGQANLAVGDITLRIIDAGGTPTLSDQLPLFTYDTGVTRSLGTVTLDTTLAPNFDVSGASVVDNGAGTIYLTGVVYVPEPASIALAAAGLVGLACLPGFRRARASRTS